MMFMIIHDHDHDHQDYLHHHHRHHHHHHRGPKKGINGGSGAQDGGSWRGESLWSAHHHRHHQHHHRHHQYHHLHQHLLLQPILPSEISSHEMLSQAGLQNIRIVKTSSLVVRVLNPLLHTRNLYRSVVSPFLVVRVV